MTTVATNAGYLNRLAIAAKQVGADSRPSETLTNNATADRLPQEVFVNTSAARTLSDLYTDHVATLHPGGVNMDAVSRRSIEGPINTLGQHPGSFFFNAAIHSAGDAVVNTMGGRQDKVAATATRFSHSTNSGAGVSQSHTSQVPGLGEMLKATRMLGQIQQGTVRPGPPLRQEFEATLMEMPVPWSHALPLVGISGYPPQGSQLLSSDNVNANANQSALANRPATKKDQPATGNMQSH